MSPERNLGNQASLKPIVPIELNVADFDNIYWRKDELDEGDKLAFFTSSELLKTLKILSYAVASKSLDYEEASHSLGLEYNKTDFGPSCETLYYLFDIEGDRLDFRLLKKAMEQRIIPSFPLLTPRQWEVLELATLGFSNNEIGERLEISNQTVKKHLNAISLELGGGGITKDKMAIIAMREGWIDPEALKKSLGSRTDVEIREQLGRLNPREREVFEMIGQRGLSNKEITRAIKRLDVPKKSVSEQTVKNWVSSIFRKLNLKSRAEIVILFFFYGGKLDKERIPQPKVIPPTEIKIKPARKTEKRGALILLPPAPATLDHPVIGKRETLAPPPIRRIRRKETQKERERQMRILEAILYLTEDGYTPKKIKDIISDY